MRVNNNRFMGFRALIQFSHNFAVHRSLSIDLGTPADPAEQKTPHSASQDHGHGRSVVSQVDALGNCTVLNKHTSRAKVSRS
jgi:hypothetical protein